MSNVSMDSRSWSFDSVGFSNTAKIDPFSALYSVMKKKDETDAKSHLSPNKCAAEENDTHLRGGMACPVIIEVNKSQETHFVTSSDVLADLEARDNSNPTEMHPFLKKKRCSVEAKSAVNKFGHFSFLSMNINSSSGLKKYGEVTCLDFQAPGPNLESVFEAYTFVGSKEKKLKFEYNGASGKHVFKCPSDKLKEHFYLGAPVIIENKNETCKLSSKRWPVVGVVGRDDELEPCLHFVTANMFAGEGCEGSSRPSGAARVGDHNLVSQEYLELSIEFARQAGDRDTERKATFYLGIVYSSRGDHEQAVEFYKKTLDMAEKAGALPEVKRAKQYLGNSYLVLGKARLVWPVQSEEDV
ncbi:PREDICTED: uncharacterized protein LOC107350424 isoform X2 [Acropora digitifera]|uniref:uncharacterized protein LOC107350424 isoform X2 n=1 Tax=Acropora digitifera TaxID=70779 RepID=UPI00077ABE6A|nr:PREDICTED: uncharacterized protein LOC107350424 isoform X2 [Acropora digitifera]